MMKTSKKKKLGIYVHIPFCERKCNYCGFLSFDSHNTDEKEVYLNSMKKEIMLYGEKEKYIVDTIFIGGGTPSIMAKGFIREILDEIRKKFIIDESCEVSIEANPNSLIEEKILEYKQAGINRISMGLQSTDNKILASIGRLHTLEEFKEKYDLARRLAIENINIDIMFALPEQDFRTWKDTVAKVIALEPEHISFYSLQLEEGTPLYEGYKEGKIHIATNEMEKKMHDFAIKEFTNAGFFHYEFSNCAKIGRECRHNLKYWEAKEFIGMGLSASSFFGGCRYENVITLKEYEERLEAGKLPINEETFTKENIEETMKVYLMTGLRKTEGISLDDFYKRFKIDFFKGFPQADEIIKKYQYLELSEGILRIKREGIHISNNIISEFL